MVQERYVVEARMTVLEIVFYASKKCSFCEHSDSTLGIGRMQGGAETFCMNTAVQNLERASYSSKVGGHGIMAGMSRMQETSLIIENAARVVVGKKRALELMTVALLAGGHVLLEDVPGLGKTLMAKALARSIGGSSGGFSLRRTCCLRM